MKQEKKIINYVADGKLCEAYMPKGVTGLILPDDFSVTFENLYTNEECHFDPEMVYREMFSAFRILSEKIDQPLKDLIFESMQITCELMQRICNSILLGQDVEDGDYESMIYLSSIKNYENFILETASVYSSMQMH